MTIIKMFSVGAMCVLSLYSCQEKATKSTDTTEEKATEVPSQANYIPSDTDLLMLIGTYTREEGHVNGTASGIHLVALNMESGSMNLEKTFDAGINPSYLIIHPSNKYVFAVNETGYGPDEVYGDVTALLVDEDKNMTIVNERTTEGKAPCHLAFNNQFSHVLVANYGTGSVTSYSFSLDGKLSRQQNVLRYQGKGQHARQEAPHAHFINQLKDDKIAVVDLGTDTIRIHSFKGSQLAPTKEYFVVPPGSGPRHLIEHPNIPILYVLNELSGTINSFRKNADGIYQMNQTVSTLAEGESGDASSAAIKISPDGRFLYATNRGAFNNIAIFRVRDNGELKLQGHQSSLGNVPRDIEISPDGQYLIAANQNSNNLVSFKINKSTGLLEKPVKLGNVPTPVCIKFFN